jgi:hypothetical protein
VEWLVAGRLTSAGGAQRSFPISEITAGIIFIGSVLTADSFGQLVLRRRFRWCRRM